MKSVLRAGNLNLRGKTTMLLRCKCCVAKNLKIKSEATRIKKEVRAYVAEVAS